MARIVYKSIGILPNGKVRWSYERGFQATLLKTVFIIFSFIPWFYHNHKRLDFNLFLGFKYQILKRFHNDTAFVLSFLYPKCIYCSRERVGKGFIHVCVSVCLPLFLDDNFWTDRPIDLMFGMLVGHYHI